MKKTLLAAAIVAAAPAMAQTNEIQQQLLPSLETIVVVSSRQPEAMRQVPALRAVYDRVKLLPLERDIKDANEEEYTCLMNEVKKL